MSRQLAIPVAAVLGIYARETGQGMIFGEDDPPPAHEPDGVAARTAAARRPAQAAKPKLKVVK